MGRYPLPPAVTWGLDVPAAHIKDVPGMPPVIWHPVTGPEGVRWPEPAIGAFPGSQAIAVNNGFGQAEALVGDELDLCHGAWTIESAVSGVMERAAVNLPTLLFGTWAHYSQATPPLARLGVRSMVRWRVCDLHGDPDTAWRTLQGDVYAVQYAIADEPRDTYIPGFDVTAAEAGCGLNLIALSINSLYC